MKKLILISIIALIGLTTNAQSYKYKVVNKVRFNGTRLDTAWIAAVQFTQFRLDTIERFEVNLYADSMDMITMQNITKSFNVRWKGYATNEARRKDSLVTKLALKFNIAKNKFIEF
jgi:hypothetical protein